MGNKILVKNISFGYDISKNEISNFSYEFSSDEVVTIIGNSGSGKSTLGLLLANLLSPKFGTINYNFDNGTDTNNGVITVFQDYRNAILPWLTIKKNILLGEDNKNISSLASLKNSVTIQNLFSNEELSSFLTRRAIELSGGEYQRIQFARAIFSKRPFVILDEADSSLDISNKETLAKVIKELSHNSSIGFIVITHDLEFAADISNTVIFLKDNGQHKIERNKLDSRNLKLLFHED